MEHRGVKILQRYAMVADLKESSPWKTLRLLYTTAKIRLGFLIMTCTLAGIAASPGRGLSTWQIGTLSLAVLLASGTAGVFNQLYERELDARMVRTRNRPFVIGRFQAGGHWLVALALTLLLALTAVALATNLLAASFVFLGAFIYGVIYTVWLKRRTWWNIVIGGLAGSFAVLAGAAAADSLLAPAPLLLAMVLFLWTPPHFWALAYAHKRDYQAAGIPMLPVLVEDRVCTRVILAHVIALVLLSLAPAFYGMGWLYVTGAVIGGVHFLWTSWRLEQAPSIQQASRVFAASIIQLGLLLTSAILDKAVLR